MTRFIYDEFSKDYLDELLSKFGEVKSGRVVASERREIDVYFEPYSEAMPESYGLLGKMASQICIFEPYHNAVTPEQIRACFGKLVAVEAETIREFNRSKKKTQEKDYPKLWVLTPTASKFILNGFRTETASDWGEGVYFAGELWRMAIVVIHQLPVIPETLLLRLLGKGKVQTLAIEEVESLSEENPLKSVILEQLYNLRQNLFTQTETDSETQELIMRLAPLYQQDRAAAILEGKQVGEADLLIRLLNRRFDGISTEVEGQIRALPVEILENLGEALFDFQSESDLLSWLQENIPSP